MERERKTALLRLLFTRGTRGETTHKTEVGEVPSNWSVEPLGRLTVSSAFGPRYSADKYDPGGTVATLRATDINSEGSINYSTMPLAQLDPTLFRDHLLRRNDFVVIRTGVTAGTAAVFEHHDKPVLPGAFLIRLRLTTRIHPTFLRYYFNSPLGRPRVTKLAAGAAQKNISGSSLRPLLAPVPSFDEQCEIVDILSACDQKIGAVAEEIALHDELFRGLLEELMTGRLAVAPLLEETAA